MNNISNKQMLVFIKASLDALIPVLSNIRDDAIMGLALQRRDDVQETLTALQICERYNVPAKKAQGFSHFFSNWCSINQYAVERCPATGKRLFLEKAVTDFISNHQGNEYMQGLSNNGHHHQVRKLSTQSGNEQWLSH